MCVVSGSGFVVLALPVNPFGMRWVPDMDGMSSDGPAGGERS